MGLIRDLLLVAVRSLPFRRLRRRRFVRSTVRPPPSERGLRGDTTNPLRVLVLGVYLADRLNAIEHLVERLASEPGLAVEHRWAALNGSSAVPAVAAVTVLRSDRLEPKFLLINKLLYGDLSAYDYIVVCDDDIHCPREFLRAFLQYQAAYDLSVAQPARTWTSYFDHGFSLRRPWWRVRLTRFVECGPLASFRRDAVKVLMPFAHPEQFWGLDFIWPLALEREGLRMGIVDAVPVDHSLRPQAAAYSKQANDSAMHRFLAVTPHLEMDEAFTVLARHRRPPGRGRPGTS